MSCEQCKSVGSCMVTWLANSRCNAIFVSNLRPKHEPNGFFIAKRDLIGCGQADRWEYEAEVVGKRSHFKSLCGQI